MGNNGKGTQKSQTQTSLNTAESFQDDYQYNLMRQSAPQLQNSIAKHGEELGGESGEPVYNQSEQQLPQLMQLELVVLEGICSFLQLDEFISLLMTCNGMNILLKEVSQPYSLHLCGLFETLRLYGDSCGLVKRSILNNNIGWREVCRGVHESRQLLMRLRGREGIVHVMRNALQKKLIYPPPLLDEMSQEGLNSEFQKQLMCKLQNVNMMSFQTISEMQMIEEAKRYFRGKKGQNVLLMMRIGDVGGIGCDESVPQLVQVLLAVFKSVSSYCRYVGLVMQGMLQSKESMGILDLYLFSWQHYRRWMQSVDKEVSPYLLLIDQILYEQVPSLNLVQLTTEWVMMSQWNQSVLNSPVKNKLKHIFIHQLQVIRCDVTQNNIYQRFLLRDYIRSLIDLSTHQSNVHYAGHSTFQFGPELETILSITKIQTIQLYDKHQSKLHFQTDALILSYVFGSLFEHKLLPTLLKSATNVLKSLIQPIINNYQDHQQQSPSSLQTYHDQSMHPTLLSILQNQKNKLKIHIIKLLQSLQFQSSNSKPKEDTIDSSNNSSTQSSLHNQETNIISNLNYESILTILQSSHPHIYNQIQKIVILQLDSQDNILLRDSMIEHRIKEQKLNSINHTTQELVAYDSILTLQQFQELLLKSQKKIKHRAKSFFKPKSMTIQFSSSQQQVLQVATPNEFIPISSKGLVAGLSLAQSLSEQLMMNKQQQQQ